MFLPPENTKVTLKIKKKLNKTKNTQKKKLKNLVYTSLTFRFKYIYILYTYIALFIFLFFHGIYQKKDWNCWERYKLIVWRLSQKVFRWYFSLSCKFLCFVFLRTPLIVTVYAHNTHELHICAQTIIVYICGHIHIFCTCVYNVHVCVYMCI